MAKAMACELPSSQEAAGAALPAKHKEPYLLCHVNVL